MGWRTKRRAKHLPELMANLVAADNLWGHVISAMGDDVSPESKRAAENFRAASKEQLETTQRYMLEFEEQGSISDPEFDQWFKEAEPLAIAAGARADQRLAELSQLGKVPAETDIDRWFRQNL